MIFHAISTLVLIILAVGFANRRNKKIHIPCMSLAFLIDLSLVLVIEFQRHAVENVVQETSLFVWFHALVSLSVLVLYVMLAMQGTKLAKEGTNSGTSLKEFFNLKTYHGRLAIAFIVLRLINYGTAFFMPNLA